MGCNDNDDARSEESVKLRSTAEGVQSLTPRERQVCSKSLYGATASEVAGQMGISARTVEAHLASAMRKTGFTRKARMLAWMVRKQIILAGDPYGPPGLEVRRRGPDLRLVKG
jgi:DNA-binding CsgD family transcriptional regulator